MRKSIAEQVVTPEEDIEFEYLDVLQSVCRESLFDFLQVAWEIIAPGIKPVWNWHIEYLCHELETVAKRVFENKPKEYDLIVNIPPGTTKSTIFSVVFPAWVWINNPIMRCICGSYTDQLATDLSRKSRDIVTSELYQAAFPHVGKLRDDQNTKHYFANFSGGYRYAVGVGGSVTGMHGHFLLVDDPIDPQQALSTAELKTANTWMQETLSSRKVDKLVTPLILIMQRLHQNDPSGARLANLAAGDVKHICLPAECSDIVSPPELQKYYVAGPLGTPKLLDPIRLPPEVLAQNRAILGNYGYSGQYDQNPVPLGGGMFKTVRVEIDTPPSDWAQTGFFKDIVRYWDKAATGGGGCFTVGTKMGVDKNGRYWVLDVIRGQWDSRVREQTMLQTAKMDGRRVRIGIEQEPGAGGKESAERSVKNLAGFVVVLDKVGKSEGDKALRADPFSVQVNGHNVSMVEAPWNHAYLEEMRYFPNSTYKDQVDASSGAFNMLTKRRIVCGAFGAASTAN